MPYLSQLQFFLFPCCFRQGWVHVTLRNKNNIGLIWFVFISSSDFLLLCHLMAKKEKLSQNAQNNLKLCQKWRCHTEDPWLEYIESIFVDFKKVSDRFCLRGFGQRYYYQARALRALGLLLADGTPTVGGGKTFWRVSRIFLRKQL